MKYFSHPSNARRAARAALGKDAKEGTDYKLVHTDTLGGQVGFEPIEKTKVRPARRGTLGANPITDAEIFDVPKRRPGSRLPGKGRKPKAPGTPRKIPNVRASKRARKAPAAGREAAVPGAWLDQLLAMLSRPQGATAAEVGQAFGWLEHTSRARISVGPRSRDARAVRSREIRGGKMVSVYRLETELPLSLKREDLGVRYEKPATRARGARKAA
jgi:hypothetical protein